MDPEVEKKTMEDFPRKMFDLFGYLFGDDDVIVGVIVG